MYIYARVIVHYVVLIVVSSVCYNASTLLMFQNMRLEPNKPKFHPIGITTYLQHWKKNYCEFQQGWIHICSTFLIWLLNIYDMINEHLYKNCCTNYTRIVEHFWKNQIKSEIDNLNLSLDSYKLKSKKEMKVPQHQPPLLNLKSFYLIEYFSM